MQNFEDDSILSSEINKIAEIVALDIPDDIDFRKSTEILKLKSKIAEFYGEMRKFKGKLNTVLEDIEGFADNKRSLSGFPEFRNIIQLAQFMRQNVMKDTNLREDEIAQRLIEVARADS